MAVLLKNTTILNNGITSTQASQFEPTVRFDPTYYSQIDTENANGSEGSTEGEEGVDGMDGGEEGAEIPEGAQVSTFDFTTLIDAC